MTDKEKAIVMAYTGIAMLVGDNFDIFHQYIEEKMGRPIWTHELASKEVWKEIKEATSGDFNRLCQETSSESIPVEWLRNKRDELEKEYYDLFHAYTDEGVNKQMWVLNDLYAFRTVLRYWEEENESN